MTVEFMEGFETALTGNDYASRGVLRLSTFEINAQPQGRNGGFALGRFGDSNGANTAPRSATTSTDPYVAKVSNKTINQIWTQGGILLSMWAQYRDTTPVYGVSPKPGGGAYMGTIESVYASNTNQNVSVYSTGNISGRDQTPTILRVSNGIVMQTDSGGSGYFRAIGSSTVTTIPNTTLGSAGFTCFDYNGTRYVGVGRSAASTTARFAAYSDNGTSWTIAGPTVNLSTNYPTNVRWLAGPNVWITLGGGGFLYRSVDGITWTAPTNPGGTATLYDVATDGTNIVAVGANVILQSTDAGITWSSRTNPVASTNWSSVACSGTRFVIANSANGSTAYSTDGGLTWTVGGTAIGPTQIASITWDGTYFLKGIDNNLEYSADGLSWRVAMRYVTTLTGAAPTSSSNAAWWFIAGTAQSNGTITQADGNPGVITLNYGTTASSWWYWTGNTSTISSVPVPARNIWFSVKFQVIPTSTTNQFTVTASVNDVVVFTQTRTWTGTQNFWVAMPNTGINFHDDYVVTNFTAPNAGDLGVVSIIPKLPVSDTQAQWIRNPTGGSNASAVNAGALSLEAGTSVQSDASNQEDIYAGALRGSTAGMRVAAIQAEAHFSRLLTTSPQVAVGVEVSGTVQLGSSVTLAGTVNTPGMVSQIFDTAPGTTPWSNSAATNAGLVINRT